MVLHLIAQHCNQIYKDVDILNCIIFARNYHYLWSKYPPDFRFHSVIFVAPENDPDILQPKYFKEVSMFLGALSEIDLFLSLHYRAGARI